MWCFGEDFHPIDNFNHWIESGIVSLVIGGHTYCHNFKFWIRSSYAKLYGKWGGAPFLHPNNCCRWWFMSWTSLVDIVVTQPTWRPCWHMGEVTMHGKEARKLGAHPTSTIVDGHRIGQARLALISPRWFGGHARTWARSHCLGREASRLGAQRSLVIMCC